MTLPSCRRIRFHCFPRITRQRKPHFRRNKTAGSSDCQANELCSQPGCCLTGYEKTHTIGLIYADMLNPFYSELAVGVERNAQLHNYSLLICNCDEQVERCIHSIDLLESRCIDALFFNPRKRSTPALNSCMHCRRN